LKDEIEDVNPEIVRFSITYVTGQTNAKHRAWIHKYTSCCWGHLIKFVSNSWGFQNAVAHEKNVFETFWFYIFHSCTHALIIFTRANIGAASYVVTNMKVFIIDVKTLRRDIHEWTCKSILKVRTVAWNVLVVLRRNEYRKDYYSAIVPCVIGAYGDLNPGAALILSNTIMHEGSLHYLMMDQVNGWYKLIFKRICMLIFNSDISEILRTSHKNIDFRGIKNLWFRCNNSNDAYQERNSWKVHYEFSLNKHIPTVEGRYP